MQGVRRGTRAASASGSTADESVRSPIKRTRWGSAALRLRAPYLQGCGDPLVPGRLRHAQGSPCLRVSRLDGGTRVEQPREHLVGLEAGFGCVVEGSAPRDVHGLEVGLRLDEHLHELVMAGEGGLHQRGPAFLAVHVHFGTELDQQ